MKSRNNNEKTNNNTKNTNHVDCDNSTSRYNQSIYIRRIMPVKFKDSVAKYDRQTKKTTVEHHYMKNQSETTLREELERCFETDKLGREVTKKGKGKLKQKIMNELARREKVARS